MSSHQGGKRPSPSYDTVKSVGMHSTRASKTLPKLKQTEKDLSTVFKSDLQNIRSIVTCTICDQLLYEPWTLGCGHTYCYSCLCSWFVPNKYKKSCPDCRKAVVAVPAPAFLIKQTVEIFTNRQELMPSEETAKQHSLKQREENQIVEGDKASEEGLFRGSFNVSTGPSTYFDAEDGIRRCRACTHEYLGGPTCDNCGSTIELDEVESLMGDFSEENDDIDPIDESLDIYEENDDDTVGEVLDQEAQYSLGEEEEEEGEEEDGSDEEDAGSLDDFVVRDDFDISSQRSSRSSSDTDANPVRGVHRVLQGIPANTRISVYDLAQGNATHDEFDEEDDDDEPIITGVRRRTRMAQSRRSSSVVSVTNITESDGDFDGQSQQALLDCGWSPLDHGHESDYSERTPIVSPSPDEESDTNTMTCNQASEDEGHIYELQSNASSSPQFAPASNYYRAARNAVSRRSARQRGAMSNASAENGEADDDDSGSEEDDDDNNNGNNETFDRDGDVEMSVSPTNSNGGRRNNNNNNNHGTSSTSHSANQHQQRQRPVRMASAIIHEVDEDSSDTSVVHASSSATSASVSASRRRRNQQKSERRSRTPDYNPRISRMFAQHQSDLRDATVQQMPGFHQDWISGTNNGGSGTGAEARVEPTSRHHRGSTAYRVQQQPLRRMSGSRDSRSPPTVSIVIPARNQRQQRSRRP